MKNKLMLYGANGYSAKLIIEELIPRNIMPILAGRNESVIKNLAAEYNCEWKAFDLSDEIKLIESLKNVHTLLNCAGPFKYTAKDLIDACLLAKTNYLDITGEMPVMHLAFSLRKSAKKNGIVILPSVGFDIIPTDCLAKRLSEKMPDATHLKLGLINKRGKISRGTFLTTLEFLGGKGKIRRSGNVVDSRIGEFKINFKRKEFTFYGISIPWGDVYSSYHSTGIPNAEVYLAVPKFVSIISPLLLFFMKLLRVQSVKNIVGNYIKEHYTGPTVEERESAETYIWGMVENGKGEKIEEVYQVQEGYNLTAKGAAECSVRVLNNNLPPGTYTPSMAFGSDFLESFVIRKII